MTRPWIAFATFALAFLPSPSFAACSEDLARAMTQALQMDYARFDQTPDEGWRRLSQRSCLVEAGQLIDLYLHDKPGLSASQKANLSFHAGQVYAFADKNDEALKRFRSAIVNPSAPREFKWSEYVLATIAFLEHDADRLVENRNAIEDAASYAPNRTNLEVVDRLIAGFGRSYKEALGQ
jgi:hypothetical protein